MRRWSLTCAFALSVGLATHVQAQSAGTTRSSTDPREMTSEEMRERALAQCIDRYNNPDNRSGEYVAEHPVRLAFVPVGWTVAEDVRESGLRRPGRVFAHFEIDGMIPAALGEAFTGFGWSAKLSLGDPAGGEVKKVLGGAFRAGVARRRRIYTWDPILGTCHPTRVDVEAQLGFERDPMRTDTDVRPVWSVGPVVTFRHVFPEWGWELSLAPSVVRIDPTHAAGSWVSGALRGPFGLRGMGLPYVFARAEWYWRAELRLIAGLGVNWEVGL